MMRFSLLVIVSFITLSRANIIRKERDACDQVLADFDTCTLQAYNDYKTAFEAGDDGRPDWMARKSCNYMTAAVEECGNMLIGECNSLEEVNSNKDHQLKGILMQLQTSIEEWDSEKCPAVKDHVDRMKADEEPVVQETGKQEEENDVEEVEEVEETATEENQDDTTEGEGKNEDDSNTDEKLEEGEEEDPDAAGDQDTDDDDTESSTSSLIVSFPLMVALYLTI